MTSRTGETKTAWLVVAASWIGMFFHFGSLMVNTFGVFLTTLCDQLGWTRTEVSLAFTLAMLTAMAAMPVTGWVSDRFGPRRPILICTAVFGAGFASIALLTSNLWYLFAIFLLLGLVGPGTSAIPHAALISRWFAERRGLALGVTMSGTALGGVVWPSAAQFLLESFGWRRAHAMLGFAVLLIAVGVMLVLLKERAPTGPLADHPEHLPPEGLTRFEVLRSRAFWIIVAGFFIFMASVQACMIHLVPMLTDRGMIPARAALAASLLGAAGIVGRVGTGYLLDRISPTRVPVIAFLLVAIGILVLSAGVSGLPAIAAAMLIGLGYGADAATIPYLVSRYFGLRSFAEIYSYIFVAVPLGGAFGPALMGMGFDRLGSYQPVLIGWGLLTIAAAGLMTLLAFQPAGSQRKENL